MKRNVLVTGGAGFIAYHLQSRLIEEGCSILSVDCFDPFYSPEAKAANVADLKALAAARGVRFEFREMDILDLESLRPRAPIDEIYHLAAKAGVRPSLEDPVGYMRANVQATIAVMEFARTRSVPRVIFASSSSIYGNEATPPFKETETRFRPVSPYGYSKLMSEIAVRSYCDVYGLSAVCLRLFTVYGPRMRPDLAIRKFSRMIDEGETLVLYGDGSTARDYTHVSDICAGILSAGRWLSGREGGTCEIFNIGGARKTALSELVRLIEEGLGKKAKVTHKPLPAIEVLETHADVSKSEKVLGYRPAVDIESGVRDFVSWYLQERDSETPRSSAA